MTTTTREAARPMLRGVVRDTSDPSGRTMYVLFDRAMSDDEMRDWHDSISSTALATEPQGYVEITEEMIVAGRKAADDQYYKWRGFGPREEGQGLDGMHFIVSEALRAALAARPAPQPVYKPEDHFLDGVAPQPASDTRVVPLALLTEAQDLAFTSIKRMRAGHVNCNDLTMQAEEYVGKLRAIIGTATPAPSDKIAEAAIDRCMQEIEDIICEADVSYPAGRDAGTSIDFDRDAVLAALRALAGKGE